MLAMADPSTPLDVTVVTGMSGAGRSATFGMSAGGRLSMTKNPRSSSTSAAADRPAPDMPVTTVTSRGIDWSAIATVHRRSSAVQSLVQIAGYPVGKPGHGEQLVEAPLAQLLHRAELLEQA